MSKNRNSPYQKNKSTKGKQTLFQRTDIFFAKYATYLLWGIVTVTILFSLLLFDLKVSLSGDDSGYIFAAKQFLAGKKFPSEHGTFYSIFLSFFMYIFGSKLFLFKIISMILITTYLIIFYYALKKFISPTILFIVLLSFSVNSELLYYSSQTYSEALFLFIQACTFLAFFKLEETFEIDNKNSVKNHWKLWLILGFLMFLQSITRSIGFGMVLTLLFYFCLNKKILHAIYSTTSFLIFYIPFLIYKYIFWKENTIGVENQLEGGFSINPYKTGQGAETLSGIIQRFFINSELYLSKNLLIIIGFKDKFTTKTNSFITILIFLIFFASLWFAFKKNKKVLLLLLYIGISLSATFVTLQIFWDQSRFILVYAPLILICLGYILYEITQNERFIKYQSLVFIGLLFLILFPLAKTIKQIKLHNPILTQNLSGNLLYGYTPDYIHYIELCKWTTGNIDKSKRIGVRKPDIAYIYSNKEFFGITKIPCISVDSIKKLNKTNLCYIAININNRKNFKYNDSVLCFRNHIISIVSQESGTVYGIFELTKTESIHLKKILKDNSIEFFDNLTLLHKNLKNTTENDYIVYPDSLLDYLKCNKIDYLVNANLRFDVTQKTNHTINTINLICFYIDVKYPGVFDIIHQEGLNDDEPAFLYQLHYPKPF